MNMRDLLLVVVELAAVIHISFSVVTFNFARRTVRYLSLAWVLLLLGLMYAAGVVYLLLKPIPTPETLSPYWLICLLACTYLQSIFPLSIPMPGYLQWERMWRYAAPAIVLIGIYIVGFLTGSPLIHLNSLSDLGNHLLTGDIILRVLMIALTFYYIINIFRLPYRLLPHYKMPRDIIFYGSALCLAALFMVGLSIRFNVVAFIAYILYFTALNVALAMRVYKPILQLFSFPEISHVETPPNDENLQSENEENFNEMNLKRFEKVEYTMQTLKPYTDCNFTRENLCLEVGLNRHLLLQCLRANGYNDIHEYISRYRVIELKQLIENDSITDIRNIEKAGFRTMKTAQLSFEKFEHIPLTEFFEAHRARQIDETLPPAEEAEE